MIKVRQCLGEDGGRKGWVVERVVVAVVGSWQKMYYLNFGGCRLCLYEPGWLLNIPKSTSDLKHRKINVISDLKSVSTLKMFKRCCYGYCKFIAANFCANYISCNK